MLVLPTLHSYLSQMLSPPYIHTALLLTPEGALVSYASQMSAESSSGATPGHGSQSSSSSPSVSGASIASPSPNSVKSDGSSNSGTSQCSKPGSVADVETRTGPVQQRSKDEVRMVAGLGAEVWAETQEEGEGMVECELGRILVLAVDEDGTGVEGTEPLLLLAVNGTSEADWDVMRVKGQKLAKFLAPSVNKHRDSMGATARTSTSPVKSRTRSTATSPGRGLNR
ncbi:hypothetical protein JVU11DRAFT_4719 [Chiua virens]|nr:hypothetical protein JVU11DRAFT_4719 [Chiua virens]